MKPSLLKYFAWISLALIAATSCISPEIIISGEYADSPNLSFVKGSPEKQTVRLRVNFKDKEISGSLLIKKDTDENLRIAFYNELGMTYLEGTLLTNSKRKKFVVNNIIPALDNRLFLKKFEKYLQSFTHFTTDYSDLHGLSTFPPFHRST